MLKVIQFLILSFFWGCGIPDYTIDCGNDYDIIVESNKVGKRIKNNSYSTTYDIVVPGTVIDYACDSSFIIVLQVETHSFVSNNEEAQRYLEDADNYRYWIIRSENDQIYGPLDKPNYLNIRSDLGITLRLKIEDGKL